MSNFDRLMAKQQDQVQLRQELRAGIKACTFMYKLWYRTQKPEQARALELFINDTEISK